jgi:hypothetical protein
MPIQAAIIEPHTPDREEVSERERVGSTALEPYLARAVVGMHRSLDRAKPINSHIRGHFHRHAIHGDLEIDHT